MKKGTSALRLFVVLLCAVQFCGCKEKPKPVSVMKLDGFTQGSVYHMVIKGDSIPGIQGKVDSLLRVIENSMSLFDDNSLICRLNRNETDTLDRFIAECIAVADKISRESSGLYDVTLKPLTGAYGFTGGKATKLPNIDSLLTLVGYRKISVKNGRLIKEDPRMQLDLNSIAQGATADYVAEYFESLGIKEYLVNIGGGEIVAKGTNPGGLPWRIGIDRPYEGNNVPGADLQAKITLSGKGLATSGNYRKFYVTESGEKVVHTVNPLTGKSVQSNLLSVTAVAENAKLADAYGTALMVMGLDKSIEFLGNHPKLDAYLVYSDDDGNYQVYMTPGIAEMLIN